MKAAVIYCRISRDPDGTFLGVERQEAECRQLCDRLGLAVQAVLVDNDISAYSGKPRPEYRRALAMIEGREAQALVAWHVDRITRRPSELEGLIDVVEQTGADVHTVTAGRYDLSTPAGRAQARILGAMARYESEQKSERLRSKHRQLAESGKPSGGGSRHFGYGCRSRRKIAAGTAECSLPDCTHDGLSIVPDEAAIVREVIAGVLAGRTLYGICYELNDRGIQRSEGGRWHINQVRKLATSAVIAGYREHEGRLSRAVWPAIVDLDDVKRVRAILSAPRQRRASQKYLLRGLLCCSDCGAQMISRPRQSGERCYVCPGPMDHGYRGCGHRRALSATIEAFVLEGVFARLDGAEIPTAKPANDDSHELLQRLSRLDERLAELGELWATGELDRVGWQSARRSLERQKDDLNALLATLTTRKASALPDGSLRDAWPDLDFDRQRAILAEIIERIDLKPAVRGRNKFDPARVSVVWKA